MKELSKKELLDLAKVHNVTGRHEMTKDQLIEALAKVNVKPIGVIEVPADPLELPVGLARSSESNQPIADVVKNTLSTLKAGANSKLTMPDSTIRRAAKSQGRKFSRNLTWTWTKKEPVVNGKKQDLPKQAQQLVQLIANAGGALTSEDLHRAAKGVIKSRQPLKRIIQYYRGTLISKGYVTIK